MAARLAPQVVVSEKSPLIVGVPSATAVVALFETVIVCAAELVFSTAAAKVSAEDEKVGSGGVTPVPLSALVNDAAILVAKVTLPVLLPIAVGANTTFALHEELIATAPQVDDTVKSPVVVTPLTLTGPSPVLVNVNTWPLDTVPRTTLPKLVVAEVTAPESTGAEEQSSPALHRGRRRGLP